MCHMTQYAIMKRSTDLSLLEYCTFVGIALFEEAAKDTARL